MFSNDNGSKAWYAGIASTGWHVNERSAGRKTKQEIVNDIMKRASCDIPSVIELRGFDRNDGKNTDGLTICAATLILTAVLSPHEMKMKVTIKDVHLIAIGCFISVKSVTFRANAKVEFVFIERNYGPSFSGSKHRLCWNFQFSPLG